MHHDPHFLDGLCDCDCEDCHLRLSRLCICPDCRCESEEDHADHYELAAEAEEALEAEEDWWAAQW